MPAAEDLDAVRGAFPAFTPDLCTERPPTRGSNGPVRGSDTGVKLITQR
jgi:hypothetical protein